jgi:hypothetical protein
MNEVVRITIDLRDFHFDAESVDRTRYYLELRRCFPKFHMHFYDQFHTARKAKDFSAAFDASLAILNVSMQGDYECVFEDAHGGISGMRVSDPRIRLRSGMAPSCAKCINYLALPRDYVAERYTLIGDPIYDRFSRYFEFKRPEETWRELEGPLFESVATGTRWKPRKQVDIKP